MGADGSQARRDRGRKWSVPASAATIRTSVSATEVVARWLTMRSNTSWLSCRHTSLHTCMCHCLFRVWLLGFRVWGSEFRVSATEIVARMEKQAMCWVC